MRFISGVDRFGLFRKYAAVLVLLVVATVVLGGVAEMAFNYSDSRDATAALQRSEARSAAVRIDQFLEMIRVQVEAVASLPWSSGVLDARERRSEFQRLMKLIPAISEVRFLDAERHERLKVSRDEPDHIDRMTVNEPSDWLRAARSRGYAFSPTYFKLGSEPYVTLAIRERDSQGLTLAELNLKFVGDVVGKLQIGKEGQVYVLDQANQVIAHPDLSLVLRKVDLSTAPLVKELRRGVASQALGASTEGAGIEGAEVVASAAGVPSSDWFVIVEQPRAEVLEPVYASLARTGLLMIAGLIAALVASYYLARRLSRPVIDLREAAKRIAHGDLTTRIDVKTGDEVEQLGEEFNSMADQLRDYTTGLERKVEEKTAKLQEAMRARALFLAAASHDLRQPLYAISLFADALADEPLAESGVDTLEKQRRAIAALRTLFDNLLDLSRFDAGEIRATVRNISLREIVLPIASEYEMVCKAQSLRWKCEVANVWVRTDPELLRRLVRNLLSNAVRYTFHGEVQLVAMAEGARATIQIVDTGVGIAPEDQARVFEEFVQLDNPARDREKGVGLGLSIVKRISELLGASLKLDSRVGSGTSISFELPIVPVEATRSLGPVAETQADFSNLRVWVVEDDPAIRDALTKILDTWKVRHSIVVSRQELIAIREIDPRCPDAVILDDMLGAGEGGLEIAQWLRTFIADERIVLVTGNVDEKRTRELESSGLVVLRKPLAASDLAQWLRDATATAKSA